jgi:hypothetical protein
VVVVDWFLVGWILLGLWSLLLFLDWIQTFIVGSEKLARLLCRIFSNRIISMAIYVPLFTIMMILASILAYENEYSLMIEFYIYVPISILMVPMLVYMHTDREEVVIRWLNHDLRKSEYPEEEVKAILVKIDADPDSKDLKYLKIGLGRISRTGDTFGSNVRKIIEEHGRS